jgi:hypothetical protein
VRYKRTLLAETLIFTIAALWFVWPVLSNPFTRIVGGIPDAFQYTWYLGWFWHAVTHGLNPFYSNEVNFPQGIGFMYNTSVIAESAIFGWLVPLTGGVFVYNLVFFVNAVLTGLFGRRILRDLGAGPVVSMWGALMFCFMPYLVSQGLGHMSQYVVSPLFALVYLFIRAVKAFATSGPRNNQHEPANEEGYNHNGRIDGGRSDVDSTDVDSSDGWGLTGRGRSDGGHSDGDVPAARRLRAAFWLGGVFGVVLAIEFYTSLEITVTFALTVAVFFIVLAAQRKGREVLRRHISTIPISFWLTAMVTAVALVLSGVAEFVLSGGMNLAGTEIHAGSGIHWAADVLSPLIPIPLQALHIPKIWPTEFGVIGLEEKGTYLGIFVLATAMSLRKVSRGPVVTSFGWVALIMFVLSLGDKLQVASHVTAVPLPWTLFSHVPFLDSALPIRLALYVEMALIAWIAVSLQRVTDSLRTRRLPAWMIVSMALSLLSWLPIIPYPSQPSYTLPKAIVQAIGKEPVYFITADFGSDMQTLVTSGWSSTSSAGASHGFGASGAYTIDTYNSYGFVMQSALGQPPAPPLSFYSYLAYTHQSWSVNNWVHQLEMLKNAMPSGYILQTPFNPTSVKLPANLAVAIDKTLGKPDLQVNGCKLWSVKHGE